MPPANNQESARAGESHNPAAIREHARRVGEKRRLGDIVSRTSAAAAQNVEQTPGKSPGADVGVAADLYAEEQALRLAQKRAVLEAENDGAAGHAAASGRAGKKLTGPGFWGMVCLALMKDASDLLLNFTLVLSLFVIVSGLVINFIIFFYLFYTGVKPSVRKLATIAFSLIIGMVPFLSILPETTASLFVLRLIENNERIRKTAEGARGRG